MNFIATSPGAFCGRRVSYFSAVILLLVAITESPLHAQVFDLIAVNSETNTIYTANPQNGTVIVTNGATNATTTLPVANHPPTLLYDMAIAVNSVTNTIYVALANDNAVAVINGADNSTATVNVGHHPRAIVVNSVTNKIYVTNTDDNTVTAIDGATHATGTITVGRTPTTIAVNEATNKIYVGNEVDSTVTVIDGVANATAAAPVVIQPNDGIGLKTPAIAVNPVTNKIYVCNGAFVTIIDGATNATTTLNLTVGEPIRAAVNSVTNKIYVLYYSSSYVSVIDGASNAVTTVLDGNRAFSLLPEPDAIAVNSRTNTIYCTDDSDGVLSEIDGATNSAATSMPTNGGPIALALNSNTNTVYSYNIANIAGTSPVSATVGGTGSSRLINISTRAQVGTGGNILIPGFVIGGSGSETLLIRADGPSLTGFGVSGALAMPSLRVFDNTGKVIATNTGWETNTNPAQIASTAATVGAFAFTSGSADCALIASLPAGAYTVQVSGVNNTTGVALAEVYEVSASGTRLINISTRAQVGTGANIIIAGFVISGTGTQGWTGQEELLLRADGPALAAFGVSGVLAEPSLSFFNGSGVVLGGNTDWNTNNSVQLTSAAASVGAFAFTTGSKDSAAITSLAPGAYTMQISGVNNTTGVALAEVYEVH